MRLWKLAASRYPPTHRGDVERLDLKLTEQPFNRLGDTGPTPWWICISKCIAGPGRRVNISFTRFELRPREDARQVIGKEP